MFKESQKSKPLLLIIDDELDLLQALLLGLRSRFVIMTANDSDKAMSLISIHKPDCILLDIRMPNKSGIEVLKECKIIYPQIPIVMMSGHGDEDTVVEALKLGAASYLKKPVDLYEVIEEIHNAIHEINNQVYFDFTPTILLVDSDQANLSKMREDLVQESYTIHTANSAQQALDILKDKTIDILITSIKLSDSDAFDFINNARLLQKNILTILTVDINEQENAVRAIKSRVFDYLKKPITIQDLTSSINRATNKIAIANALRETNKLLYQSKNELDALNTQLLTQKNSMEKIIQLTPSLLLMTDVAGNIVKYNIAAIKYLKYTHEELVNLNIASIIDDKHLSKQINIIIEHGFIKNLTKRLLAKTQEKLPFLISATVLHNEKHEPINIVWFAVDISDQKPRKTDKIEQLTFYNDITVTPEHTHFEKLLPSEVHLASANKRMLSLLLMKIYGIDVISENFNYFMHNRLLQDIASRIIDNVKECDYVTHLGSEKFALISTANQDEYDAWDIAKKVTSLIKHTTFYVDNMDIQLQVNIGIALYPLTGTTGSELFMHANSALNFAESAGRNIFCYMDEKINEKNKRHAALDLDVQNFAEIQDQFHIEYQPIYKLPEIQPVGVEAFIRWQHPQFGYIQPLELISIAEKNGRIMRIGEWVIEQAFVDQKIWREKLKRDVNLSINLSPCQILNKNFLQMVETSANKHGTNLKTINFELTETAITSTMNKAENIRKIFFQMRLDGSNISIDNFGTYYSSLTYLKDLPVATLKIAADLINNLNDKNNVAIVKSVIDLAKNLNLSTIAEGVEEKYQLDALIEQGCNFAQGFYLSKPVTTAEIEPIFSA